MSAKIELSQQEVDQITLALCKGIRQRTARAPTENEVRDALPIACEWALQARIGAAALRLVERGEVALDIRDGQLWLALPVTY